MNKKIIENFLYQGLYQVTIIILPIITIPIVSHALGVEGVGIYNYITSIVSYFILFAGLGLATYGIREIATVKESKESRSKKFWELEFFNIIIVCIAVIIYTLFLLIVDNKVYYVLSGISLLATLFDISWFYYGIQDFKHISLINIGIKIISFLSILIFINQKDDLVIYFLIQSLSILISNISLWIFLKEKVIWIKPTLSGSLSHLKPALNFFIGKISITLYTTMNKTLLGIFVTTAAVGLYSNSLQLITMIVVLIGVLDTVLMPYMTSLFTNEEEDSLIKLMEKTIDLQLFFSIPLMFGIILTNSKIIPWFYGEEFTYLNKTIPILAPLIVIMPLGISLVRQFLMPKNNIKQFNISVIIAAFVSVVINLLLLPSIGIWGAIIATLISEFTVTAVRIKDVLKNSNFKFKLRNISAYFFSGLLMLGITYILTKEMTASITTTLIQVVIGIIIYMLSTYILKKNILFNLKKEGII
ncbi:O-antigen/teichoic acid export membrane protein [Vagococcus fluvialis]|uniref:Uncharacterized protein n=1 Tax=Vagococcus fluvialis TaxID=2738 RepID=A0A369AWG3_9ENTE|nr:oligosaccharide flippase family protein [Vagococcus fluvialis]MBO0419507.1 oligosaccharide flippase family protein [Vagococcus fluvialis]RCX13639.1 O-antigen/teichoic acid export membrane protein [Vagococcus fluvialis]RSU02223.1 hypothetical protein CBF32_06455 [Vagococcus fluvialis]